jgi:YggT family protein
VAALINFVFFILNSLLSLLVLAIIAAAILSWLVAFNVINSRNQFVYQVMRFLEAVTEPVLWPFRRFIPALGGVDITPILAILVIQAAQRYLLPPLHMSLLAAVGAY